MKSVIVASLLLLGLAACSTPTKPEVQIVYKFVRVPVEMTEPVTLTPPPEPEPYSQLSCERKEAVLIDLIQARTVEVGVANKRLSGIQAWSEKQGRVYENAPAP